MVQAAERTDISPPPARPELTGLTDALALWNAQSETAYLSAGEELQAIHAMLRKVEAAMARTIEVMTGPDILTIDTRLGHAADLAAALEANGLAIGQRLSDVLAGRSNAGHGNEQVARAFSLLDYVALVARTHTGSRAGKGGDLAAFLDQVTLLVGSGRGVARNLSDRLADLHRSLEEAAEHLRARQMEDAQRAPLLDVIASLTRELSGRRVAADDNRQDARRAFGEAAQAVAEIVGVLQFHDIARQRLEHVIDHLRLMSALADGQPLGCDAGPPDALACQDWIARIALLERAQLADLAGVYQGRMALIASSLDGILDQARGGASLIGAMLRIDTAHLAEGRDMGITRQARQLEERFLQREMRREAICNSVADCIRAAGQFAAMTDALDNVEFSLRLAGFNAAIHAAYQDGGDRTIGYIAHEIRDSAASAKAGADLIRAGIATTAAAADELQTVLLPTEVSSATAVREALAGVLAAAGDAEAECLRQLSDAEIAAAQIPDSVARAKSLMQSHVEGLTLMHAMIDALEPLANVAGHGADASDLITRLAADYTMQEERRVMASVFGTAFVEPAPEPQVSPDNDAGNDDLSDVFF